MPSLLVIVFALQLTIHLVNTFGVTTINNLLWFLFNLLPIAPTTLSAAEQKMLKKDFMKVRMEMNATSAQDDFAKWAKLRRKHDKLHEQLEKSKATAESTRATFDKVVNGLRWLGLNGVRMLLQFWFQKQPMFWIPTGWAPYYAEWLLSFPRAPVGSVSIQSWAIACLAFIVLVSDAIVSAVKLVQGAGATKVAAQSGKRGEPMKVPAGGEKSSAKENTAENTAEKKEL